MQRIFQKKKEVFVKKKKKKHDKVVSLSEET